MGPRGGFAAAGAPRSCDLTLTLTLTLTLPLPLTPHQVTTALNKEKDAMASVAAANMEGVEAMSLEFNPNP